MLTLYHGITSVCSVKVRIGLAEIGLKYQSEILDLPKGDQFNADYLKLNPAGVVPTLVDADMVLVESSLILDYLDRTYNRGLLMPKERIAGEQARHWLLRCLTIHGAINTLTFSTVRRKQQLATQSPDQIAASIALIPDPVARSKRSDLIRHGLDATYVPQALLQLRSTFKDMSLALGAGEWLSGKNFGISDIALIAYIDRLERLGFEKLWFDAHPRIGQWLATMQARDSYKVEVASKISADSALQMRVDGAEFVDDLVSRYNAL